MKTHGLPVTCAYLRHHPYPAGNTGNTYAAKTRSGEAALSKTGAIVFYSLLCSPNSAIFSTCISHINWSSDITLFSE